MQSAVAALLCTDLSDCALVVSRAAGTEKAYIKDDEVKEDKENMHHDPHDQLQLADNPPGVLQGVCQILALLIDLRV